LLGYLLLALLPVAAVIYIAWAHRKRAAEQAAASSKRFAEMFGATPGTQPATALSSPSAMPAAAAASALCAGKDSILDARHALLFRALTTAMSGFHVFPHVSLAALVQLPAALQGRAREQRLRVLAQHTVDCLVCDEGMQAIAAIDIEDGASAESRIKSDCLAAARLRYLRFNPAALPAPHDIRELVLGVTEKTPA